MSNEVSNTSDQDKSGESSTGRQDQSESSRLQALRVRRGSPVAGRDAFATLVSQLQQRLVDEIAGDLDLSDPAQARATIQQKLEAVLIDEKLILNRNEKRQVVEAILRELIPGSNTATL